LNFVQKQLKLRVNLLLGVFFSRDYFYNNNYSKVQIYFFYNKSDSPSSNLYI